MRASMIIDNMKQLDEFARAFAQAIKPPCVVLFVGDLGSGKTTFIKHLVKALGSSNDVTSPTFTLLNTYEAQFPIHHFDMYRLGSAEEARDAGFEEYFDKSRLNGVVFVEWPQNVEGLIKDVDYVVEISKQGENRRLFVIKEGKYARD